MTGSSSLSQSAAHFEEEPTVSRTPLHFPVSPHGNELSHSHQDRSHMHFDAADLSVFLAPSDATTSLATGGYSTVDPGSSASAIYHARESSCTRPSARASMVRRLPGVLELFADTAPDRASEPSRSLPSFLPIDAALDAGIDGMSFGVGSAATIHFSPRHSALGSPHTHTASLAASRWTQMSVREWATFGATTASRRSFACPAPGAGAEGGAAVTAGGGCVSPNSQALS